jgi:hypothetical protein
MEYADASLQTEAVFAAGKRLNLTKSKDCWTPHSPPSAGDGPGSFSAPVAYGLHIGRVKYRHDL